MVAGMIGLNLALPTAWVVKCKKCGCTINCRAVDPQIEHSEPDKAEPPPHDKRHGDLLMLLGCVPLQPG
jgi:hypothetical protein